MFYKICYFENPTIPNDVKMTALTKQWRNSDLRETKQITYHLKGIDKSYPKINFLLNWSDCVKSYRRFCQILALFTMPNHQIWSCHMTQDANFEKFLFSPNSTFNIAKSHKISRGKALYVRNYQRKTSLRGGKHPPPPSIFRVNRTALLQFQEIRAPYRF